MSLSYSQSPLAPPLLRRTCPASDTMLQAGTTIALGTTPWQVVRGIVLIRQEMEGRRPLVLEILGPGAMLCARAAAPGTTAHAATVVQLRRSRPAEAVGALMRRVMAMQERAAIISYGSAEQRMAWLLSSLAGPGGGGEVALPLRRGDMATYLGLTPETVARTLTALRQRGLLGLLELDRVEILRPEALRALHRMPVRRRRQTPGAPTAPDLPELAAMDAHAIAGRA